MDAPNIVLTGMPRSGTTLGCYLLHKLPDTVALSEPLGPGMFADLPDNEAVCDGIERFYAKMRKTALRKGIVRSRNVGGKIPDNHLSRDKDEAGRRRHVAPVGRIAVGKELTHDFNLVIKNPIMFTALLPNLAKRFPCYAIVRNPLAAIASSVSSQGWVREKRAAEQPTGRQEKRPADTPKKTPPPAEPALHRFAALQYDKTITDRLAAITDATERRFAFASWFFERYEEVLPRKHIIRYEDIVGSGGRALGVVVPSAAGLLDEPLESKNLNEVYGRDEMLRLGERLLGSEGAYWRFYSRESVEELLEEVSNSPR